MFMMRMVVMGLMMMVFLLCGVIVDVILMLVRFLLGLMFLMMMSLIMIVGLMILVSLLLIFLVVLIMLLLMMNSCLFLQQVFHMLIELELQAFIFLLFFFSLLNRMRLC